VFVRLCKKGNSLTIDSAEITLEKSLFTTYQYNSTVVTKNDDDSDTEDSDNELQEKDKFAVELTPIAESLSLASKNNNNSNNSNTDCTIFYKGSGYPFILIFEDNKMIERCEFSTFINLELEANNLGFELNQRELLIEGIIKSDVLYDALKDLKDINAEEIYIYGSYKNQKNKFAIISKSDVGHSTLYLPNERSILEKLIIHTQNKIDISCYKFAIFNKFLRAIKLSNKCKFKRDENILSLNLLSLNGHDLPKNYSGTVIDFKILQLSDKDEDLNHLILEDEDEIGQEPTQQHNGDNNTITNHNNYRNGVIQNEEEEDNGGIDVPIFL